MISAASEFVGSTQRDHIPAGGSKSEEHRNSLQGGTIPRDPNPPRIHRNQTAPNGVTTWKPPASKSSLDDFGERVIRMIKPQSEIMGYLPPEIPQRVKRNTEELLGLFRKMAAAKDSGEITKLKEKIKPSVRTLLSLEGKYHKNAQKSFSKGVAEIAKYLWYLIRGESGQHDHLQQGRNYLEAAVRKDGKLLTFKQEIENYLDNLKAPQENSRSSINGGDIAQAIVTKPILGAFGRNRLRNKPSQKKAYSTFYWNTDPDKLGIRRGLLENVRKSVRTNYNLAQILLASTRQSKRTLIPLPFWSKILSKELDQLLKDVNILLSKSSTQLDKGKILESCDLLNKCGSKNILQIIDKIEGTILKTNTSSTKQIRELFANVAKFVGAGMKAKYYEIIMETDPLQRQLKSNHIRKQQECRTNIEKICKKIATYRSLEKRIEKWKENKNCAWEKGENRLLQEAICFLYCPRDVALKNIVINSLIKIPTEAPVNDIIRRLGPRRRENIDKKWNALLEARRNYVERQWNKEIIDIVNQYRCFNIDVPKDIQNRYNDAKNAKKSEELERKFYKASNEYEKLIRHTWNYASRKIPAQNLENLLRSTEAILNPSWKAIEEISKKEMMPLVITEEELTNVNRLHTQAIAQVQTLCEEIKKTKSAPPSEADGERRKKKWMRTAIWATAAIAGVGIVVAAAALAPVAAVAVPVIIAGSVLCLVGAWRAASAANAKESRGRLARWWGKWVS